MKERVSTCAYGYIHVRICVHMAIGTFVYVCIWLNVFAFCKPQPIISEP